MIPPALLIAGAAGCTDQEPTGPQSAVTDEITRVDTPRLNAIPFNRFFTAWSRFYSSGPIQTQMFALDPRQQWQYIDWYPDEAVLSFAKSNPGHVYIVGDEPDQWCIPAYEYAGMYHNVVSQIRSIDQSARISPAGFAEPNDRCCPEPATEECRNRNHFTSYATQFYDSYRERYGAAPPVHEWRFHDFGVSFAAGDVGGWWSRIDAAAAWSVAHGANMVLGAWGFHGWRDPVPTFQEYMKQAMGRLMNDSRINGAVYWSYEPWVESPRPLAYDDGSLTAEGQTHANPLTDVPVDVKLFGSADGYAMLRWTNTTAAWGAEVEFWVQQPGTETFVYRKTEHVAAPGSTQTPFVALSVGNVVRARVRYYNAYGQAAWTPFSNTVVLELTESEPDKWSGRAKNPLLCFLRLC